MAYRKPSAAQQAESDTRREELLGKLADGIDKLTTTEEWQRYLTVQAKFPRYSFGNVMLILCQRPDASQVMPFGNKEGTTGWKSVGRSVNKGETSIRIWAPSTRKVEVEQPEGDKKVEQVTGWRLVPVFDVSQTSGEELPEPVKLLEGEAPEGVFAKLTKVAESIGFTVQVTPEVEDHEGANGLCDHEAKLITVAGDRSEAQRVKTLAHEVGHALLHGNREAQLTRNTVELEAESTAYVVCQSLGMDTADYSLGYVAGWKGNDPDKAREAIKASGARIHQASKQILDGLQLQAEKSAEVEPVAEVADFEIEAA